MRRTLFHRLQQIPAIYWSEAPLFAFSEGEQPLIPIAYAPVDKDNHPLSFVMVDTHYEVEPPASPETVVLVPVPGHAGLYIFQQSDGPRTAFYGALRLTEPRPGFDLFSPQGNPALALDAAIGEGATPGETGYRFTYAERLLAALVPVALDAPASAWDRYYIA
jgi:hypothetical protein